MGCKRDGQRNTAGSALKLPMEAELAEFRRALLRWFACNGRGFPWRARTATTYVRVISEILLQRTQAPRVAEFFARFVRAYPSWRRLARAREDELQQFLQPLGLWRRRAASIVALAREMERRGGRFPATITRKDVELLPGVGQYIANAILLLCRGERQPLLDVNMARVLERNFGLRQLVDIRYDPYLQALGARVVSKGDARKLNWAILDLAASVCLSASPLCSQCPLSLTCRTGRGETARNDNCDGLDAKSPSRGKTVPVHSVV